VEVEHRGANRKEALEKEALKKCKQKGGLGKGGLEKVQTERRPWKQKGDLEKRMDFYKNRCRVDRSRIFLSLRSVSLRFARGRLLYPFSYGARGFFCSFPS